MSKVNEGLLNKVKEMTQASNVKSVGVIVLDEKPTVNFEENIFNADDEFEMPDNREEAEKVLIEETYENLPVNNKGEHPKGYSIVVEVTNNGNKTFKKFRLTAPRASFPEYRFDAANNSYVPTGRTIGPDNDLARNLKKFNTQGQCLDALLGKKLKVTSFAEGNAAGRRDKDNRVISTTFRRLPVFEIV